MAGLRKLSNDAAVSFVKILEDCEGFFVYLFRGGCVFQISVPGIQSIPKETAFFMDSIYKTKNFNMIALSIDSKFLLALRSLIMLLLNENLKSIDRANHMKNP